MTEVRTSMRSRIAWAVLVLAAVLIAIALLQFNLSAQQDEELFWIIQNGIRNTGMPSFAKVETPDRIWNLVNYVRTLPGDLRTQGSSK